MRSSPTEYKVKNHTNPKQFSSSLTVNISICSTALFALDSYFRKHSGGSYLLPLLFSSGTRDDCLRSHPGACTGRARAATSFLPDMKSAHEIHIQHNQPSAASCSALGLCTLLTSGNKEQYPLHWTNLTSNTISLLIRA